MTFPLLINDDVSLMLFTKLCKHNFKNAYQFSHPLNDILYLALEKSHFLSPPPHQFHEMGIYCFIPCSSPINWGIRHLNLLKPSALEKEILVFLFGN